MGLKQQFAHVHCCFGQPDQMIIVIVMIVITIIIVILSSMQGVVVWLHCNRWL